MLFLKSNSHNPYFNLACEEFLLKNRTEEIFMLWRNDNCIVVGKNQNTLAEINPDYVRENGIKVARRLSGGGAVYHDLGNVNFTFVSGEGLKDFNNFRKFTAPVIAALQTMGVSAEFTGRNDLTIKGRKFSGNAQYNYKNRMLHHGTLLFSSEIRDISGALRVSAAKYEGKQVKSVAKRVTNISENLPVPMAIEDFMNRLSSHVLDDGRNGELLRLSENELQAIRRMAVEKYASEEWIYGKTPVYTFHAEKKFPAGKLEYYLQVEKGIIRSCRIHGDYFGIRDVSELEKALEGVAHSPEKVLYALAGLPFGDFIAGVSPEEFTAGMF